MIVGIVLVSYASVGSHMNNILLESKVLDCFSVFRAPLRSSLSRVEAEAPLQSKMAALLLLRVRLLSESARQSHTLKMLC